MQLKQLFLLVTLLLFVFGVKAQQVFNIKRFGAVTGIDHNNSQAIQKAVDACFAAGGGRVLVPSGGTFVSGPFKLKSFVEFYVEPGAKLLASKDETLYTESAFGENKGEGST